MSYTPLRQISDNKPNTISSLPNLPPDKTNIVKYFLIFFNREEILEIFQYFHNMGFCQYDKGNIVQGKRASMIVGITHDILWTPWRISLKSKCWLDSTKNFCRTPVLGLGPGIDFTFAWDNNNKNNNNSNHQLNFLKGRVQGD